MKHKEVPGNHPEKMIPKNEVNSGQRANTKTKGELTGEPDRINPNSGPGKRSSKSKFK